MNPVLALFLLFLTAFVILLLQQWLHNRRPTYTATATIVNRRTEPGRYIRTRSSSGLPVGTSAINYIVTFRLSDGEELELLTGEEEYYILQEGLSGQLHWQGNDFRYFESQEE